MALLADKIVSLKLGTPLFVASGSSMRQVIETIQQAQAGSVLIVEGERLIGIMTERDVLMKVVARRLDYDKPVDEFMTPNPRTLRPTDTLGDAINLMNEAGLRNIPIVDEAGVVSAVFRARDVIHHLAESFPAHVLNLPPRPNQKMKTAEGA
ncbi:MAG: CBS domain-containing protein [Chloroflexi bacterium]|nr:CBS domain-containing protein [Chloroflexota bacterium]